LKQKTDHFQERTDMNKEIKVELIAIGNELLGGITVNTNSSWLGQKLTKLGLAVHWVTVTGDTPAEIEAALFHAGKRADLIITTGGLGPTPDDLTRQAIGRFFKTGLILHQPTMDKMKNIFSARNLTMPELNRIQAMVPQKAVVISNPLGTAPGLELEKNGKVFYFLPGVPHEMKMMMEQEILSRLKNRFTPHPVAEHLFRTTGIPESRVYEKIAPVLNLNPEFQSAFLPKTSGIDIRLKNYTLDSQAELRFNSCMADIRTCLEKYIYSESEESLPEVLGRLLSEKKLSLALAESFTGGLVADWITNVPGSSAYFSGAVIAYSNKSKTDLLKVPEQNLKKYGAVSEEVARDMMRGVQQLFGTDCAISTTGIAGPGGATVGKPVGLCYIATGQGDALRVKQFNFGRDRRINKERGAAAALELLRRLLLQID
jgi:nicotinamide-nucleotide amidase